jgi:hypothetical protein
MAPVGKSDHSTLLVQLKLENSETPDNEPKPNYNKGDYESFRNFIIDSLQCKDYKNIQNLDEAWKILKEIIIEGTAKFIPVSKSGTWSHKPTWKNAINQEAKNLIKRKHRLWSRYMETRDPDTKTKYNIIRNRVRQITRNLDKDEQVKVAKECKENPKKFWRYIKSRTKATNKMGNLKLKNAFGVEDIIVDNEEKSNAFADYFSTVFTQEPNTSFEVLPNVNCKIKIDSLEMTEQVVKAKLAKLKNRQISRTRPYPSTGCKRTTKRTH